MKIASHLAQESQMPANIKPKRRNSAQIRHFVVEYAKSPKARFTNRCRKLAIIAQSPRDFSSTFWLCSLFCKRSGIVPTDELRDAARHSLFLTAQCDLPQSRQQGRVRLRNVSAQGLMAEGLIRPDVGEPVVLMLRNIGRVEGMVAWARGDRFGVVLATDIEAQAVLAREAPPAIADEDRDYYQRGPVSTLRRDQDAQKIRPI